MKGFWSVLWVCLEELPAILALLQASARERMRTVLFLVITQGVDDISNGCFGKTSRYLFKNQSSAKKTVEAGTDSLSRNVCKKLPLRNKILLKIGPDSLSRKVDKMLPLMAKRYLTMWPVVCTETSVRNYHLGSKRPLKMRQIVSKRRQEIDTARCIITQKSAVLLSIIYVQIKYNNLINILTILSFKNFTLCTLMVRCETSNTTRTATKHCTLCHSVPTAQWLHLSHTTFGFPYLSSDVDNLLYTSCVMTCKLRLTL